MTTGPAATRPRLTAEERREAVLEAALVEFAQRGRDGTSTEDVARRAGISQPYLFRLFPTKKDLFLALVDRCFELVSTAFVTAAGELAGQEAFDAMGAAYGELLADRDLLLLQLQIYAGCADPEVQAAARAGYRALWRMIERITGGPPARVAAFFATGMLLNVAAALDLPAVDEGWAELCTQAFAAD